MKTLKSPFEINWPLTDGPTDWVKGTWARIVNPLCIIASIWRIYRYHNTVVITAFWSIVRMPMGTIGGLHLLHETPVDCWITWLISNCEKNDCYVTFCKIEQIHKMTTIFTFYPRPFWICSFLTKGHITVFFLSLR